jgi:hypothetical protein
MTKLKTIRVISLGDAKRLTRGVLAGGMENFIQPNHQPTV